MPGRIASFFRNLLRKRAIEQALDDELKSAVELLAQERMKQGLSHPEARRQAVIELGGVEQVKEEVRAIRSGMFLETFAQDLRYTLRILRKSPGFTTVAVLTLALGIGANAAIFSYIDAWFIKPLPYPQPDRLVIFETQDKKHGWTSGGVTSAADFFDFQKQNTSFGRTFTAEDDRSGAPHVAILSQGLWQGRYAGDPKIIGRNIAIGGEAYTVVGVMPGTFQLPLMGIANLWTPLALTDMQRADRGNVWLPAFGRLKPGVTLEQARAETATFFAHLEKEFPKTNTNLTWLVSSMTDRIRNEEGGPEVMICFVVVGLVLLIACANVANLMLARATSRTREFAVRGALGATRRRLAGQLLTESLLLFLAGGVASLLFASWGMRWIESQIPGHIRGYIVNYGHIELDFSMLMFTLGITLLCGLVFGFAPAFENSRLDVNHTLKETSGQTSGSKRGARLRRIFVAAEIALAVVVLISATLLVKSFIISVRSSPGYNPANVLVAQLALPKTKYTEDSQFRNFSDEVLSRIRALPGAASTSVASHVPFGGFGQGVEFQVVGKPLQPGERQGAPFTAVSADYFSTMQIGLVKGRFFDSSDAYGTSPSIIISQTMARQVLSGEDPIGKKLRLGDQHSVGTIVGIVNDIKMYYLRERPGWHIYVPLAQFPSRTFGFVVRSSGDPTIMATAIRDAIWAVDRDQPISSVEPLENLIAAVNTGDRVVADLMVFFSVLAMFLGAIGIYGVMAHLVSQRIHEIGIRMALGASPVHVMRMVLSQGLKLALGGVGAGVLAALGATRLLATQLYQVTPTDPLTFIGVPLLLAIVALAACYVPAWRGMRVDPLVALRHE